MTTDDAQAVDTSENPDRAPFVRVEVHDVDNHHLRVFKPRDSGWLARVASEYRKLRTESITPLEPLTLEGVDIVDVAGVEEMLAEAGVPTYQPGNFGVIRSDLAELLLAWIQADEYGCKYGYRSIRDRELVQLPGRGIDQIGVELAEGPGGVSIALILGEAKSSSQAASPPTVVDTSEDCLRVQHRGHLADLDLTIDKVLNASRHARDPEVAQSLRIVAHLLRKGDERARIVVSSLMVRPADVFAAPTDFGSFFSSPSDYEPANVRFILVSVPGSIDEIAKELGELAAEVLP